MKSENRRRFLVPSGESLPPPRPGVRHVQVGRWGAVIADDELRERVEGYFYWPMIVLALLVLPLLLIEFHHTPEGWQAWSVDIGFGIIWLAFLVEFIIKIAIAESRVEYIKRNWLDVIIIIVPLLRPLRLGSAAARTTRVFKLRGVGMKFARHAFTLIIGLEATDRLLHRIGIKVKKERKLPDEMTRYQLMDEVKDLRQMSDAWERWYEEEQAFLAERGVDGYGEAAPKEGEAHRMDDFVQS